VTENPIITRREVRERAMQTLYAYEISKEAIEMLVETIFGFDLNSDAEHYKFAQNLVYSVLNHRNETDVIIKEHSKNWHFDRLATLDLILLRLGLCEFLYFPDIPVKVTINEYVDIAKRFSTEKSGGFINGMLDKMHTWLAGQERIQKVGRGLLDV